MDIPTSFICIINFIDGAFKYGGGSNLLGYVGTNAKALCVEFYNFMQCNNFVNDLTC
jgi:hypothetical protein